MRLRELVSKPRWKNTSEPSSSLKIIMCAGGNARSESWGFETLTGENQCRGYERSSPLIFTEKAHFHIERSA
jgi:hypothetical protein